MGMAIAARILRVDKALMSPFEMLVVIYIPTINVRHPLELHLRRMLIAVKYILSDGIVVWRAWVLWGPSRRFTIFIPPLFSLGCTLGEHKQTAG